MALTHDEAVEIIRQKWVKQVHVDEEGEFSDCPPDCDDCTWKEHFDYHNTPLMDELIFFCDTFPVKSRYGKVYTYYKPTEKAYAYLIKNAMKEIEK